MDQIENPDQEQLELPQSYSPEPMSSYDTVIDYQEEDDELTENTDFDTKLNKLRITKIDTKRYLKNTVITDLNDRSATNLIQRIITERKRKQDKDSLGLNEKVPKLDNAAASSYVSTSSKQNVQHGAEHDTEKGNLTPQLQSPSQSTNTCDADGGIQSKRSFIKWREVKLKKQVKQLMKEKGRNFKLKLYLVETKQDYQFSKQFAKLATAKSRESLCREKEVCKSYILFFYRNVEKNDREFRAEIYALTTGSAWQNVLEYADKDFSKLVEKRTLKFPFKHVEYKKPIGNVLKKAHTARPGHEITFSTWDYLGKLIGNRTRSIRDNSSLFAKDLDAFRTPKGKPMPSQLQVTANSMKILRKLSISQLGRILDHFSQICSHQKTFLDSDSSEQIEETDEQMFEMHDFMEDVTDVQTVRDLNESLHKVLEQSMNGIDSNLYLVHEDFDKWSKTDKICLYAYKQNTVFDSKKRTRRKRQNFETWFNPPSLDEVMACLRNNVDDEYRPEWLTDVNIKFGTTLAPLKKFIFSRFSAGEISTYIYNHGKWIAMKAEYFCHIERDFVTVMSTQIMKQSELPQLLPWKHPGGKKEDGFKVVDFDETKMRLKWRTHFTTVCNSSNFDKVLEEADSLSKGLTQLSFKFGELEKMTPEEKSAHLYRLLECNLNEDDYNAAHTLLNMMLPDNYETKVVTCDKKTPHGIELCDILIYNDTTTYLVHVKAGFDGGPIREVCSQIRNAADNIFREQTISNGTGIIDKYWDVLTKEAKNSETHENVVKRHLENMTKEKFKKMFHPTQKIVFVLACRDTRTTTDFTKDIPHSLEVPLAEKMKKSFTPQIVDNLTTEGYINDKGELTNKFILEENKETRVQAFRCMESIKTKKVATEVDTFLVSQLPKSKSTIAKMEIIRLAHDFERYSIRNENIQLKLYKVESDFHDVN